RLQAERRERRVRAEEADRQCRAQPRRDPPPLGGEREDEPEQERAADVDRERAPRKRPALPAADEALEPVAREGAERARDCDREDRAHAARLPLAEIRLPDLLVRLERGGL